MTISGEQLLERDRLASAGWAQRAAVVTAGADTSAPRHAPDDLGAGRAAPAARSGWPWRIVRLVRDAAVGLALLTAIPLTYIGSRGERLSWQPAPRAEQLSLDHFRPLMAPRDASITPERAAAAFRALEIVGVGETRARPASGAQPLRPWQTMHLDNRMFAKLRAPNGHGLLSRELIYAAYLGFTPEETGYLRMVADAPIWRDFDIVASANAVDMMAAVFASPIAGGSVGGPSRQARFYDVKLLANAAVARAAYHMAVKEYDKAEAALRSLVSFGVALADNGGDVMDILVGRIIADIGRDGLYQYAIAIRDDTGLAEKAERHVPTAEARSSGRASLPVDFDANALRARLLADADNADNPRGLRFEALRGLAFSSCGSVQSVLFGPDATVRDAFDRAATSLARYPSDRAYLEYLLESPEQANAAAAPRAFPERLMMGAATVAGTVLGNPRISACTRVVQLHR